MFDRREEGGGFLHLIYDYLIDPGPEPQRWRRMSLVWFFGMDEEKQLPAVGEAGSFFLNKKQDGVGVLIMIPAFFENPFVSLFKVVDGTTRY